ncbi:c-type cytochrome [Horticoccus sp. 23ND18S-11]|uniref:c-type cytochrome n=1 Tax=Horticoccus sp. 23ND18S-11 TaxID=3391832 RepID=UPI0039C91C15
MSLTARQLLKKSRAELDALFAASPAGPIPVGEATGTAIAWPGTLRSRVIAWFGRVFLWQGKIFDPQERCLRNRVSMFSLTAIKAEVYTGTSWFDGRECIVIDYSKTSLVAKVVRDEIRLVAPGLYLGQVYLGQNRKPILKFSVGFQYQPAPKAWRRFCAIAATALLVFGLYLAVRLNRDVPVTYAVPEDHFKYGSTGGERDAGVPYWMWKVLPVMFAEFLPQPDQGLASLGFVFDPTRPTDKDLPVGVSKRNVQGIDRVFLNCAVCHVGTVRDTPESTPRIITGMPANTVDLQAFERFLFNAATSEKFTPERLGAEMKRIGASDDIINRIILRYLAVDIGRRRLLFLRDRFKFMDREPDSGPGRVDTFNPPKVLLNFRMDLLPEREWVGNCDLPSVWHQAKRKGMWLHWDGNNNSVEERNRSASFGTGAIPPTLDRPSIRLMETYLLDAAPLAYPFPVDEALAARGAPIYREYCARCHGASGTDFSGELVGQVTPIEVIRTDRHRLDSYSPELAANQNLLYAANPDERFRHFRKTYGYANQPLDGLWLRAPYLHNGSVPTLRDLLKPADQRPKAFHRGYDVYDPKDVGFVSQVATEKSRKYFRFDTSLPGNGNFGHEGREYGTELSPDAKNALIEYLKKF